MPKIVETRHTVMPPELFNSGIVFLLRFVNSQITKEVWTLLNLVKRRAERFFLNILKFALPGVMMGTDRASI